MAILVRMHVYSSFFSECSQLFAHVYHFAKMQDLPEEQCHFIVGMCFYSHLLFAELKFPSWNILADTAYDDMHQRAFGMIAQQLHALTLELPNKQPSDSASPFIKTNFPAWRELILKLCNNTFIQCSNDKHPVPRNWACHVMHQVLNRELYNMQELIGTWDNATEKELFLQIVQQLKQHCDKI